jgi:hypothetical protein
MIQEQDKEEKKRDNNKRKSGGEEPFKVWAIGAATVCRTTQEGIVILRSVRPARCS